MYTKFYQNRREDIKAFWCFFGSQCKCFVYYLSEKNSKYLLHYCRLLRYYHTDVRYIPWKNLRQKLKFNVVAVELEITTVNKAAFNRRRTNANVFSL